MSVLKKLQLIQSGLVVQKLQRNNFGKYNYRSLEDINQALKPLLKEHGLSVFWSDEIKAIGDRVYIKATCTITDGESSHSVDGWAREPMVKKGMDESQITGTASSYARKYAANGLFLIDDNSDPDSLNSADNRVAFVFDAGWDDWCLGLFHQGATIDKVIEGIEAQSSGCMVDSIGRDHLKKLNEGKDNAAI